MRSYGQFCPIARGSEILAERPKANGRGSTYEPTAAGRDLARALPTWNAGPREHARIRAEHGLPAADLS